MTPAANHTCAPHPSSSTADQNERGNFDVYVKHGAASGLLHSLVTLPCSDWAHLAALPKLISWIVRYSIIHKAPEIQCTVYRYTRRLHLTQCSKCSEYQTSFPWFVQTLIRVVFVEYALRCASHRPCVTCSVYTVNSEAEWGTDFRHSNNCLGFYFHRETVNRKGKKERNPPTTLPNHFPHQSDSVHLRLTSQTDQCLAIELSGNEIKHRLAVGDVTKKKKEKEGRQETVMKNSHQSVDKKNLYLVFW